MLRLPLIIALLATSVSSTLGDSPYRDVTLVTWSRATGTQVEYFDKTSAWTFVWRSGYAFVEPGQVLQVPGASGPQSLCFRYGPQIRERLGPDSAGFQCVATAKHERSIVDRAKGDVFGLSKRDRTPFRLPRKKTTLDEIKGQLTD